MVSIGSGLNSWTSLSKDDSDFSAILHRTLVIPHKAAGLVWFLSFAKLSESKSEVISMDGWLSLVEGTGFENRRRFTPTGGSNPSPSALILIIRG